MSKTLSFLLALSLLVVFSQCKHDSDLDEYGIPGGGIASQDNQEGDLKTDASGSNDWDDDDDNDGDSDWDQDGSGWGFNKKHVFTHGNQRVTYHFKNTNNGRHQIIHLKNCFVSNCMNCIRYNCRRCMPGFRLKRKKPYSLGRTCVLDCPFGVRDANGRCRKNVCNTPHCKKCDKFRAQSCLRCEEGWYRYKAPYQLIANCVNICPRGYRAKNRTRNLGPTCEKIQSFCYNVPHCSKCDKFPWTRSCLRCENGWYRYKPPYQLIAKCVKPCPRGYRAAMGTRNFGPTCKKIPSFCYNAPHCSKCDKFPWTRSCLRCENGWYRYKAPYQLIAKCVRACPRGYRAAKATRNFGPTCQKIPSFCYNTPNCLKCDKLPWTRSCIKCEKGWYRYKAQYQHIARCVRQCPRGYRATVGRSSFGPTCEKIPSFCYNTPNCLKCDKLPWTRSCIKCEKGWYRYKAPYQHIARCVRQCPRGYRATFGRSSFGPTCEKIPSFCYNTPNCLKCDKLPWTRSCIQCEKGWYRYKAPYQHIARCVRQCPQGYRATVGRSSFGPTCEKIPSFCHQIRHCKACQGPQWKRSCKRCEDGWYRYKAPHQYKTRCIRTCPRGYQTTNGTRKFGPTCKKIPSFCHQLRRCDECPGFPLPRSCKRCEKGWYRYKPPHRITTKCIKSCPLGYQATKGPRNFGPTCKRIPSFCLRLPHCKLCPDEFPMPRSCQRCEEGWYRYSAPYAITVKCIKTCPRGYLATNGTHDTGPTCKQIPSFCHDVPNCKECSGPIWPSSCNRCVEGWYRYEDPPRQTSAECVRTCPTGFQATNGTGLVGPSCEKLETKCRSLSGCEVCPKVNVCLKCKVNMSIFEGLFESKCVYECPKGFEKAIRNHTSICVRQEGCLDKFCFFCKKGWYKLNYQGRVCHRQCPIGYFKYQGNCMKCTSGCRKCNSVFKCSMCAKGKAKLTSRLGFGERCVLNCPRGYTKELVNDTSYECRKVCYDRNCENCESVSFHGPQHCDYCKIGFHKLQLNLRDKCVVKCPKGYTPKTNHIEGSVCRKGEDVSATPFKLLPTTPDYKPTTFDGKTPAPLP